MHTPAASTTPAAPSAPAAQYTPAELSAICKRVYTGGTVLLRFLQHYRPYICPFHELLPLVKPGSTVLDVGCGGGLWLVLLRETGRISRGVGFDSSKPAIDLARALPPSGGAPIEFLHLPAQAEWPQGPFDVVSIIDVLHHVPTDVAPSLFVNAFARLRPGGLLIYKDMYPGSWRSLCNRLHDLVMAQQIIHLAQTERIAQWAAAAGFRPVLRRRTNMLWYGHELHVFERPSN